MACRATTAAHYDNHPTEALLTLFVTMSGLSTLCDRDTTQLSVDRRHADRPAAATPAAIQVSKPVGMSRYTQLPSSYLAAGTHSSILQRHPAPALAAQFGTAACPDRSGSGRRQGRRTAAGWARRWRVSSTTALKAYQVPTVMTTC